MNDILLPGGKEVGAAEKGAGSGIRTVTPSELDGIKGQLLEGATEIKAPANYEGKWYQRSDGTIFGFRNSKDSGPTIDVIQGTPNLRNGYKVHAR